MALNYAKLITTSERLVSHYKSITWVKGRKLLAATVSRTDRNSLRALASRFLKEVSSVRSETRHDPDKNSN